MSLRKIGRSITSLTSVTLICFNCVVITGVFGKFGTSIYGLDEERYDYVISKSNTVEVATSDTDLSRLSIDMSSINTQIELKQEKLKTMSVNDIVYSSNNNNNDIDLSEFVDSVEKHIGSRMELPDIESTSFKGYMCRHKVTNESTGQYAFLNSGIYDTYTDSKGFVRYKDYYVVAMGNYYADYKVGKTYRVTTDMGQTFDVITGDIKQDGHTDERHMYRPKGEGYDGRDRGEIIEFVISCGKSGEICSTSNVLPDMYKRLGDLDSVSFQGNIARIDETIDADAEAIINELY